MIYADTAIVCKGMFFHYCHKIQGFIVLRIHYPCCPLCFQKNPDYVQNTLVHTVTDLSTGRNLLIFRNINKAIQYIQEHPFETLALGDAGFVH